MMIPRVYRDNDCHHWWLKDDNGVQPFIRRDMALDAENLARNALMASEAQAVVIVWDGDEVLFTRGELTALTALRRANDEVLRLLTKTAELRYVVLMANEIAALEPGECPSIQTLRAMLRRMAPWLYEKKIAAGGNNEQDDNGAG